MKVENIRTLWNFEGFITSKVTFLASSVKVFVHFDKRRKPHCPHCGRPMGINRIVDRRVKDLALGTISNVEILLKTIQGKCSRCGSCKTFLPDEISENATATKRLQHYAFLLCRFMSPAEASQILPYSDDTIRRWDQNILEEEFGHIDLEKVSHILIDEKSIGKRHRYVTLVLNGETGELLYMGQGKKCESLRPFFEQMTLKQRERIKFACMDRNAAYNRVVTEYCQKAKIIFDKFHIEKNLHDAVDAERREEMAKANKEHKGVIKGKRYIILRHKEKLNKNQKASLDDLLSMNEKINAAYYLKESFRQLWCLKDRFDIFEFICEWADKTEEKGLKHLMRFGEGLLDNIREILATVTYGLTNAPIERFNGTVARIIARGYGFRNMRYLFLKLRQQSCIIRWKLSANLR